MPKQRKLSTLYLLYYVGINFFMLDYLLDLLIFKGTAVKKYKHVRYVNKHQQNQTIIRIIN